MGGYIRMDKDLEDDPRVDDLAKALGRLLPDLIRDASPKLLEELGRVTVLGGLYRLWRYGDTYLGRHDRLKGASRSFARIAEVTALPVSLLELFPSEWLKVHADGSVELPGYSSKNALVNRDERRESGRKRTARWRERKRTQQVNGDASHAVTGEASQRHKSVTTGTGSGTGTGTVPSETGTGTGPVENREPQTPPRAPLARLAAPLAARAGPVETDRDEIERRRQAAAAIAARCAAAQKP
jgi:hypothetical protein